MKDLPSCIDVLALDNEALREEVGWLVANANHHQDIQCIQSIHSIQSNDFIGASTSSTLQKSPKHDSFHWDALASLDKMAKNLANKNRNGLPD